MKRTSGNFRNQWMGLRFALLKIFSGHWGHARAQLPAETSGGAHAQLVVGPIGAAQGQAEPALGPIGAAQSQVELAEDARVELAEDAPVHVPTVRQHQMTTSNALAQPPRGVVSLGNQTCPSAELYHLRHQIAQARACAHCAYTTGAIHVG